MLKSWLASALNLGSHTRIERRRKSESTRRRQMLLERLDDRRVLAAVAGAPNANELVQTGFTANELAASLVGGGLSISNATFTGGSSAAGSFSFTDSTVIGFGQGIMLSSGSVADVVGPNAADWISTYFGNPGDADLSTLAGYETFDAAVLEFDFVPTANQVVFQYTFASDEYPEWVNTPFNDVFAFYVNGTNYATVRQTAGDPNSAFVPVAVNNINAGNPLDPAFVATRPDLFRANYVDPNGGPSAIDLELDGLTHVLTFQAPVNPGVTNHMKLAIADASDGIYDSAVFLQAGSLVSNENPVADLSLLPLATPDSSTVTAVIEAEDPNGLPLSYTINWGDGTSTSGPLDNPVGESEKTALVDHNYASAGDYLVTLTVSNGSLSGTSVEDIHIGAGGGGGSTSATPQVVSNPIDQMVMEGDLFSFTAYATGNPAPDVQWQVSTDGGLNFTDIAGATAATFSAIATAADNGSVYQAVFSNTEGEAVTTTALLTVDTIPIDNVAPQSPVVVLASDTGASAMDGITSIGYLAISGIEDGAVVEYSVDSGNTWTVDFAAAEGQNSVLVRQTDQAGNISDAAILDFLLDTQAPVAPQLALVQDSGNSASDGITNNGALTTGGAEANAVVKYSGDAGSTWADSYFAHEGMNTVEAQQTDLAGNVSAAGSLSFLLDTTAPSLNPTFSAGSQPILVNAQGVTVSPNATDASGIATQSAGLVNTATAGKKSLICSATDLAGNSTSVNVPYVVGYAIINVTPQSGATYKKKSSIPVSFQLADANGRLSDTVAASLAGKIVITFDSQSFSGVTYNKKTHAFSLSVKPSSPTTGTHTLGIHVYAGADEVATFGLAVNII